jgi:outer membrane protein OmpA-like peptidoglycan-associated protein
MRFLRILTALTALAAVSACATPEPMASAPPPPPVTLPAPVPAPPVISGPVVVHFGLNKSDITASTMQVLYAAAQEMKAAKPSVIRIHGFTDSSGKAVYNKMLSEKRAKAVADQLAKLGITARVEVMGQGLVKPVMKGKKDQAARRVEITWEAPAKSAAAPPATADTISSGPDLQGHAMAAAAAASVQPDSAFEAVSTGPAPVAGDALQLAAVTPDLLIHGPPQI